MLNNLKDNKNVKIISGVSISGGFTLSFLLAAIATRANVAILEFTNPY